MTKTAFSILLFFSFTALFAQRDTIFLNEVLISDLKLLNFSSTQNVKVLNDSVIRRNSASLTALLTYNSHIFFRENGFGMVSSPSFRGTSAQQTAVVWNGININSQFNGQTDFNTIQTQIYDQISVRAGGGSVIYGTGAIGGTIHLGSELKFGTQFRNRIQAELGSFSTSSVNYNVAAGEKNWTVNAAISRNSSENDFDLPYGRKNVNGQYSNLSFAANMAFRINKHNNFKFYSTVFDGEQHFSLLTPSDTKTKYINSNSRNLIEFENISGKLNSKFRAAFLSESYDYFANIQNDDSAGSDSETFVAKYDGTYSFKNVALNGVVELTKTSARGTDIANVSREILSVAVLMKHQVSAAFNYEAGIRAESANTYESPILYSVGAKYQVGKYAIRINGSRNFRIPTFNDLFWLNGGNTDLKPESSYQVELGNEVKLKNVTFSLGGYYMKIDDMIQWFPGTTTTWYPRNVNQVNSYGTEANVNASKSFGDAHLLLNVMYDYTISENDATGMQLIYVPFHKLTTSVAMRFRRLDLNYQMLFTGETFSTSDNDLKYAVKSYSVSNIAFQYALDSSQRFAIGGKIRNVFDAEYEVVRYRTFPGRNYAIYLTLNF